MKLSPRASTDAIARLIGERVNEIVGRPVIIENEPGAEDPIAGMEVKQAKLDGCRILFATSGNLAVLPYIRRNPPYDPLQDFSPIAEVGRYNFFLVVSRDLPGDVQSFVQTVRGRPDAFNFATGINTNLLVFPEMAAIRHRANTATPQKTQSRVRRLSRLS